MVTYQECAEYRKNLVKKLTDELYGPEYTDDETRQCELLNVSPLQLYSTGVLFPQKSLNSQLEDDASRDVEEVSDENSSLDDSPDVEVKLGSKNTPDATDLEEQPLNLANEFSPSAAGITVRASPNIQLMVDVTAGRYKTETVEERHPKAGQEKPDGSRYTDTRIRTRFRRLPITHQIKVNLGASSDGRISPIDIKESDGKLKLHIRIRATIDNKMTVSIVLVNHHKASADASPTFNAAFFQVRMSVMEISGASVFHPIDRAGGVSTNEENGDTGYALQGKTVLCFGPRM